MTTGGQDRRAAAVLPLVRAAMARGDGPPAVRDWVRTHGEPTARRRWTADDEARARVLAGRLARRLAIRLRAGADTCRFAATVG